MPLIYLATRIDAPIERVFDLARSIDAHVETSRLTGEKAIGGRTEGLIEAGETVLWEARHFGIRQKLEVKITAMDRPHRFEDAMLRGAFSYMHHAHIFSEDSAGTQMQDEFNFRAPLGPLGTIAEKLFLRAYMRRFLVSRNRDLKRMAESDEWRKFLPSA